MKFSDHETYKYDKTDLSRKFVNDILEKEFSSKYLYQPLYGFDNVGDPARKDATHQRSKDISNAIKKFVGG